MEVKQRIRGGKCMGVSKGSKYYKKTTMTEQMQKNAIYEDGAIPAVIYGLET